MSGSALPSERVTRYEGDMGEIWGRYGGDMREIWGRYGGDMGDMGRCHLAVGARDDDVEHAARRVVRLIGRYRKI